MIGSIIVWNDSDSLGGMSREKFKARLKDMLKGRVEEAWIFRHGSPGPYAGGILGAYGRSFPRFLDERGFLDAVHSLA